MIKIFIKLTFETLAIPLIGYEVGRYYRFEFIFIIYYYF